MSSDTAAVSVPTQAQEEKMEAPPSLATPASGQAAAGVPEKKDDSKQSEAAPTVNGTSEPSLAARPAAEEAEKKIEEAAKIDNDSEMRDTEGAAQASEPREENGSSGTPAKSKSKRPSTGGASSQNKTLKKKQSKAKMTNLDCQPGDYFLARLRSFPPWPSIICDEEMLPDVLLKTRPVTAIKKDGTYNEPYADGGKKVGERTYAVMFLDTNEFGWIPNTDLTPLTAEEAKDVQEKGKTKSLISAFKIAAEGHDLQHYKDVLLQHEAAIQDEEDRKRQLAEEKAAKAEKKKRKSEAKVKDDEDGDVEMEDAEPTSTKKSSKKRKKEAESDDEQSEKPAKTPKTATKLKLTTAKTSASEKKSEKKSKPKTKKKAESTEEEEKEVEPVLDPAEARKAREKEVLFLRHKLQKGFLSREQAPQENEMPQMATYIKKLEGFGDTLEVAIIRATKINKVLKGLVKLNTIPSDEQYHFRERSVKLLGIWNQLLGAEPADEKADGKTNGESKEAKEDAEEEAGEKISADVKEPTDKQMKPEDAVEKISAEVKADAGHKAGAIEEIEKDEPAGKANDMNQAEKSDGQTTEEKDQVNKEDQAPKSAEAASEAQEAVKDNE